MMRYKLQSYSIWEMGQRSNQEDSLFPIHGRLTDNDRLFILCDGMGGHASGEVASSTVCQAMSATVLASCPNPEGPFSDDILLKAIENAFNALDTRDPNDGSPKKMGTTMTFLKLHDSGATIAHMGDSRVYHIRPGRTTEETRILFMTEDHSLVNDLVKVGEITREEARTSRQKNVITRAMQPHMERRPRADIYHTADIRPGDYFFLCSDGVLENWDDPNVRYCFSQQYGDDVTRVQRIIQETAFNKDNHTAIIVHVMDVEGSAPVGSLDTHEEERTQIGGFTSEDTPVPGAVRNADMPPTPTPPPPSMSTRPPIPQAPPPSVPSEGYAARPQSSYGQTAAPQPKNKKEDVKWFFILIGIILGLILILAALVFVYFKK